MKADRSGKFCSCQSGHSTSTPSLARSRQHATFPVVDLRREGPKPQMPGQAGWRESTATCHPSVQIPGPMSLLAESQQLVSALFQPPTPSHLLPFVKKRGERSWLRGQSAQRGYWLLALGQHWQFQPALRALLLSPLKRGRGESSCPQSGAEGTALMLALSEMLVSVCCLLGRQRSSPPLF